MTAEILTGLRHEICKLREEPQTKRNLELLNSLTASFERLQVPPNSPSPKQLEFWLKSANHRLCQLQSEVVSVPKPERRALVARIAFLEAEIDVKRDTLRVLKREQAAWLAANSTTMRKLRLLMRPILLHVHRSGCHRCVDAWLCGVREGGAHAEFNELDRRVAQYREALDAARAKRQQSRLEEECMDQINKLLEQMESIQSAQSNSTHKAHTLHAQDLQSAHSRELELAYIPTTLSARTEREIGLLLRSMRAELPYEVYKRRKRDFLGQLRRAIGAQGSPKSSGTRSRRCSRDWVHISAELVEI